MIHIFKHLVAPIIGNSIRQSIATGILQSQTSPRQQIQESLFDNSSYYVEMSWCASSLRMQVTTRTINYMCQIFFVKGATSRYEYSLCWHEISGI